MMIILNVMTLLTMMTIVFVWKLEVVQKQGGGYQIP